MQLAPLPGDVFLVFNVALQRYAHTGIVVSLDSEEPRPTGSTWYLCTTIEGNTNAAGSRDGNVVARKQRRFYPDVGDRFVRWVDLEKQKPAGSPVELPDQAA